MKLRTLRTPAAAGLLLACWAGTASAHSGHGLPGSHWHATDTLGLLMVAVLAAAALWISRR